MTANAKNKPEFSISAITLEEISMLEARLAMALEIFEDDDDASEEDDPLVKLLSDALDALGNYHEDLRGMLEVASGAATLRQYHTLAIQFRVSDDGMGTPHELNWRHQEEEALLALLLSNNLGRVDGGQIGGGSMEIYLDVTDIAAAAKLVIRYLTNEEYIGFAKVASLPVGEEWWTVHYPAGAGFNPLEWDVEPGSDLDAAKH